MLAILGDSLLCLDRSPKPRDDGRRKLFVSFLPALGSEFAQLQFKLSVVRRDKRLDALIRRHLWGFAPKHLADVRQGAPRSRIARPQLVGKPSGILNGDTGQIVGLYAGRLIRGARLVEFGGRQIMRLNDAPEAAKKRDSGACRKRIDVCASAERIRTSGRNLAIL
jgi:hypothetical protein